MNQIKSNGETQSTGAQVNRLQAQLNGKQQDFEIAVRQKEELEKIVKSNKNDILESEKKAADYYTQLLRVNENFQILQNEQKLLSQDLTQRTQDFSKLERERLALERELLQLRPLKHQLENYSQATQKTIEENVRAEYDRGRLQQRVTELQNEVELAKGDAQDVNFKYNQLLSQNQKLVEQLRLFEQESFEIQARIRRGLEVEKENECISRGVEDSRTRERELTR